MSLDVLVLLALENEPTVPKWNQALTALGTSVRITEVVDLSKLSGFLPMTIDGKSSGCEFLRASFSDISDTYPAVGKAPFTHTVVYQLSFKGDVNEAVTCLLSASALVAAFKGVAFDPQEGRFVSERELRDAATSLRESRER